MLYTQLNIHTIQVKEETDGKVKELKNALRKSEHECADLQFLNSQYAHKLKALQKQDQAKSNRIQQLHVSCTLNPQIMISACLKWH